MPSLPAQINHDMGPLSQTDYEEHTHPFGEGSFAAKNVLEPLPASFNSKKRLDYDGRTDSQPVYVGFAPAGTDETTTNWVIQQISYDSDGNPTAVDIAMGVAWSNRVSEVYT